MIRTSGLESAGKLVPSLAFAGFCAAVLLIGNNLPAYTLFVLLAIPSLAILRALTVREPFTGIKTHDVTVVLFGLMAYASLAYTVSQRTTEASLPWLSLCLVAYLLARYMAAPGTLGLLAKVLVWAVCATVLDQILVLTTQGIAYYPLIFSTFLNKNIYGGVLASAIPLVFLAELPASGGRAVLKAVYGTIILAGLVLTFSKGAWLIAGMAVVAIAAFCLIRRDRRTVAALGFAVLLGLVAGFGLDQLANKKAISSMAMPTTENVSINMARSVTPRLEYWRNALAIAGTAPLIGRGYDSFAETHIRAARWPIYSKAAHNYPLQILTELGLVGLALFLFTIGSFGFSAAKHLFGADGEQSGRIPFAAAALIVLAHGCLDFTLNTPEGALWFWLLLGIGCPWTSMARSRERRGRYSASVAAGVAGVILLTSAGVLYWRQETIDRLAKAAAASKDPGVRVQLLSQGLQIRREDDRLLAERAAAYWRLGRLDLARGDLLAAIDANAYKPAYRINLAHIATQTGAEEEARRLAEQALAFNPTIPGVLEGYGMVVAQTGDRQGGAAAVARAILLQGAEACAWPPDAIRDLLASCIGLPGQPGGKIHLALAAVEYRLGHYEQSYKALPAYATLPEEDKYTMARLAAALREKGYGGGP